MLRLGDTIKEKRGQIKKALHEIAELDDKKAGLQEKLAVLDEIVGELAIIRHDLTHNEETEKWTHD